MKNDRGFVLSHFMGKFHNLMGRHTRL
jgi:hypothetical protein